MCRQRDCLFVCEPSHWVKRLMSEHFRCPRCIHEYQPWSMQGDVVPAQKLLVVRHEDVWHAWPCEWQDSYTTRLQNRMKDIWNDLGVVLRGKSHAEIIEYFCEKARLDRLE